MRLISRLREHRYCAFCKSPRNIYVKKHIDVTNVLAAFGLASVFSYVFWSQADPRALGLLVLALAASEVFIYMRWRASIVCTRCGFDPVIYKKSPERASKMVGQFYRDNIDDPKFQLGKSPLLEMEKVRRLQGRKAQELKLRRDMVNRAKTSLPQESPRTRDGARDEHPGSHSDLQRT